MQAPRPSPGFRRFLLAGGTGGVVVDLERDRTPRRGAERIDRDGVLEDLVSRPARLAWPATSKS